MLLKMQLLSLIFFSILLLSYVDADVSSTAHHMQHWSQRFPGKIAPVPSVQPTNQLYRAPLIEPLEALLERAQDMSIWARTVLSNALKQSQLWAHEAMDTKNDLQHKMQDIEQKAFTVGHKVGNKAKEVAQNMGQKANQVSHEMAEKLEQVSHEMSHKATEWGNEMNEKVHQVGEKLHQVGEKVLEKGENLVEKGEKIFEKGEKLAENAVKQGWESVKHGAEDAAHNVKHYLSPQPQNPVVWWHRPLKSQDDAIRPNQFVIKVKVMQGNAGGAIDIQAHD